jgi:ADP-heptose:LPS heptosyltransferase
MHRPDTTFLPMPTPAKILIIRRDNIGDLLCTTPLITALRSHYPDAHIAALVNDYNAPVIVDNPHLDQVWSYTKAKHSDHGKLRSWWREYRLYRRLRAERFDLIIHANPTVHPRTARLVRYLRPRHAIGVVDPDQEHSGTGYDLPLTPEQIEGTHHVERVFSLLRPLGIQDQAGPMVLVPPSHTPHPRTTVGIHISSRKPCNRWPLENFQQVIGQLHRHGIQVALFWAPGSHSDRHHPGDDQLADTLCERLPDAIIPCPTRQLSHLVRDMAAVDVMLCADGGALHISSALGKPTVALFGCTSPDMWGPWKVPSHVLVGDGQASAIPPEAVTDAVLELLA